MRHHQRGFTLVEIAIVLVIIGLLLGGVLKGQELINSAKVKNMVNDFRSTQTFISAYQDRFRRLPGDQDLAQLTAAFGAAAVNGAAPNQCAAAAAAGCNPNNGLIDGNWNDPPATLSESVVFWQHVRLANLAAGPLPTGAANYAPTNADGGQIGVESGIVAGAAAPFIAGLRGSYFVCMNNVLGRYVRQIDTTMDDGNTADGTVRAAAAGAARGAAAVATAAIVDGTPYVICVGF
jgi:prepilin-type N-terminal cleavage/methylation domain-containing protein